MTRGPLTTRRDVLYLSNHQRILLAAGSQQAEDLAAESTEPAASPRFGRATAALRERGIHEPAGLPRPCSVDVTNSTDLIRPARATTALQGRVIQDRTEPT